MNARVCRRRTYADEELAAMMVDTGSDLVERQEAFAGEASDAVRQAICAFANDLPGHARPGVVFVGTRDDGTPSGIEINDALLLKLSQCRSDGNILPPPTMTVAKHTLQGREVAVVTVSPSDTPPVRYRGRIWIRVGPSRALASAQDERILNERRRHGDIPFDVQPVRQASLADLDLPRFQYLYLPNAFDAEVLAANDRTIEERLAATKMIVSADDPAPTVLGLLMLNRKPSDFLPGAYVQFLRFDGTERHDPIEDSLRFDAPCASAASCSATASAFRWPARRYAPTTSASRCLKSTRITYAARFTFAPIGERAKTLAADDLDGQPVEFVRQFDLA